MPRLKWNLSDFKWILLKRSRILYFYTREIHKNQWFPISPNCVVLQIWYLFNKLLIFSVSFYVCNFLRKFVLNIFTDSRYWWKYINDRSKCRNIQHIGSYNFLNNIFQHIYILEPGVYLKFFSRVAGRGVQKLLNSNNLHNLFVFYRV